MWVGIDRRTWIANAALSEAVEKGEQIVRRLVASSSCIGVERRHAVHCSLFESGIGMDVGLHGFELLVTEK